MAKKGLGSGLDALFGGDAELREDASLLSLPIGKVEPAPGQPRERFEPEALESLTDSIRQHGVLQPIAVRALGNGYYQIIAGERRWRAAREAGLDSIPARVVEADDRSAKVLALVENLQRQDLNPVEQAEGLRSPLACSTGFRSCRCRFSTRARTLADRSSASTTLAGMVSRPASRAARHRRSPAMI